MPTRPTEIQPVNGSRIMVVDDEEDLVKVAVRGMPYYGYVAEGFSNPIEAMEELAARPRDFDAVVTDLQMPGMNGLELVRVARSIRPDLPVVLTSGFITQGDREQAEALTVTAIVPKPVAVGDLARHVTHAIDRHSTTRASIYAAPFRAAPSSSRSASHDDL